LQQRTLISVRLTVHGSVKAGWVGMAPRVCGIAESFFDANSDFFIIPEPNWAMASFLGSIQSQLLQRGNSSPIRR